MNTREKVNIIAEIKNNNPELSTDEVVRQALARFPKPQKVEPIVKPKLLRFNPLAKRGK